MPMPGSSNRWWMLAVLFLARTAIAFQFQTIGSTGPLLREAFSFDFAQLGSLIGLYMLPGTIVALPGGLLGQRFGAKRVVLVGLALMVLGGLLTGTGHELSLWSGRLVSGIGAVLINVLMTKMLSDWFAGREIVTAMSTFIASWPLGLALGLITFPPLAAATAWATVMHAATLLSLASLLLMAIAYRQPPGLAAEAATTFRINLTRREWWLVSVAGLIWGTYNVGYIVLISFLPESFVAKGYSVAEASRIVSLLGLVLIPSVPLAGYLAERQKRPVALMMTGFAGVAAAASALPFVDYPIVPFGVLVLAIGLPAGLIMALPAQALRPESRSVGMGVYYTCYYASMALLPVLAGVTRDVTGSPAAPALFAAAMMLIAALGLLAFRNGPFPATAPKEVRT